jgi:hypothetical protein
MSRNLRFIGATLRPRRPAVRGAGKPPGELQGVQRLAAWWRRSRAKAAARDEALRVNPLPQILRWAPLWAITWGFLPLVVEGSVPKALLWAFMGAASSAAGMFMRSRKLRRRELDADVLPAAPRHGVTLGGPFDTARDLDR